MQDSMFSNRTLPRAEVPNHRAMNRDQLMSYLALIRTERQNKNYIDYILLSLKDLLFWKKKRKKKANLGYVVGYIQTTS